MNRIEKICFDTTNKYIYNIIREQREDNLIDRAKKYTDYQVDGLPCVYRYDYIPQNDEAKPTRQEELVQNLVWCFKNDVMIIQNKSTREQSNMYVTASSVFWLIALALT